MKQFNFSVSGLRENLRRLRAEAGPKKFPELFRDKHKSGAIFKHLEKSYDSLRVLMRRAVFEANDDELTEEFKSFEKLNDITAESRLKIIEREMGPYINQVSKAGMLNDLLATSDKALKSKELIKRLMDIHRWTDHCLKIISDAEKREKLRLVSLAWMDDGEQHSGMIAGRIGA